MTVGDKGSFRSRSPFAPRTTRTLRVWYQGERVRILSESTEELDSLRGEVDMGQNFQVQVDAAVVLGDDWRPAYKR